MTDYAAVDESSFTPSESDYLQAELMPEVEPPAMAKSDQGELSLTTLEPTLEATESVAFNFVDRPVSQEPPVTEEIFTRLLTPWSLAGLLLLVAANGLLTVYSFTAKAPTAAIAMTNLNGLPPVTSNLPPIPSAAPDFQLQKLSEIAMPQQSKQDHSPVAIAPSSASNGATTNVIPAPTTVIPPAQPVPMAGYSPYLQSPGAVPSPGSSQSSSQSPQNLPTIAIQPMYQPPAAIPLPPPPPPPVNNPGNMPLSPPPAVNGAPSMASSGNGGNNVESQMYQQLPSSDQTAAVIPSNNSPQSFNQQTGQQGTRNYNQRAGNGNTGSNLATQNLVQELESLNQAPY